jgi:hypothetical protein
MEAVLKIYLDIDKENKYILQKNCNNEYHVMFDYFIFICFS